MHLHTLKAAGGMSSCSLLCAPILAHDFLAITAQHNANILQLNAVGCSYEFFDTVNTPMSLAMLLVCVCQAASQQQITKIYNLGFCIIIKRTALSLSIP